MSTFNQNWTVEQEIALSNKEGYPLFEATVANNFASMVGDNTPLFTTDVDGVELYDAYISNLAPERQQHYLCNACRHFIQRYGNLVTVTADGKMKSVLWDIEVPEFFKKSVEAMKQAVLNSKVNGVFVSDEVRLGTPKTGIWTHLHAHLPKAKVNKSRLHTAYQLMAEKREEFGMLNRALQEYSLDTTTKAVQLLNTETLYRSDKCLGVAKHFKALQELLEETLNSKAKHNLKWLYVATAPVGFCRIKSSMIGTLLDDIQSGLRHEVVAIRFAEKMNPNNYMRSQTAPTAGNVAQAERIVAKLGIANSLLRRYATIEEIPEFLWRNHTKAPKVKATTGIFGHLEVKNSNKLVNTEFDLPTTVMTWDKFQRTVLPTAESLEVKVDNPSRLMALVTSSDTEAENILQWSNPFSWYYHGGIDGEMKARVEAAGGQYENNEIRCSLMWEGYTDLDLHCITPTGREICFSNKRVGSGWLDIDMNGGGHRDPHPVENIRWANNAPQGRYKFIVNNFCERGNGHNLFKVELEVNGQIFVFEDVATAYYRQTVFEFDYYRGEVRMISNNVSSVSSASAWNIEGDGFVKVNGITTSPNLWGDNNVINAGTHVFFLLDGCKDSSEGKGRGFFVETLKSDLYEIRKTLEAYMASATIENAENATACGVGYTKDNEWNLIVKVASDNSTRYIKIDRWD